MADGQEDREDVRSGARAMRPPLSTSENHRGRRREAGVPRQVADGAADREVRNLSVPLSSRPPLLAEQRSMKLEPVSRRRPLSSTGAGVVEMRLRFAYRSSTRAGPCDAVVDIIRSRRL